MKWFNRSCALFCTLAMLIGLCMVGGFSAAALPGGGQKGTPGIKGWGCDLSYWNESGGQPLIDFEKMAADGCDFAIFRFGYNYGSYEMDPMFMGYYERAHAAGIAVGAYFYGQETTYAGVKADAEWMISMIEQYDLYFEYPLYYDVEEQEQIALGSDAMTQLCLGWCETMAAHNYFPGVYGGKMQVIDKLQSSYTNNYEVWYAAVRVAGHGIQYDPREYDPSDMCGMWQYAWYDCNFDGVTCDGMDANVAYKDYAAITAQYGYNNVNAKYTVTFDSMGGSAVPSRRAQENKAITAPTDPTKAGYLFDGWYDSAGNRYDFSRIVTSDFTLYAHWARYPTVSDFMPTAANTKADDCGSHYIWPYFDPKGFVTMYKGGEGRSWPTMTTTYQACIDLLVTPYLHVKTDGNAEFNARINYVAADGKEYLAQFSEIAGQGTTDFAAGAQTVQLNLEAYVRQNGGVPADGKISVSFIRFYVIGSLDQYVSLLELKTSMDAPPTELTSDVYDIDQLTGVIAGVDCGGKVEALYNNIKGSVAMKVFDGGNEAAKTAILKTGFTVKLYNGSTVIKSYVVAVNGDVDGDGALTSRDGRMMLTASIDKSGMEAANCEAADYDRDSLITTADARLMLTGIVI